ncbi:MAG: fumarylacetoacetate hydrolase family protein [Rhodospirillaceae bacterium]|nr:fumarylacetoacetate hydrolase family protein [Rhodospirillaceae bacterium]MBL6930767.1 fumarylacetoacetate hydrolase family protein [Rhodospirillales bacterium]MBL6940586.1 fumarylacetoacetate hydrolase family protein [Rhodospirillales bacterium]
MSEAADILGRARLGNTNVSLPAGLVPANEDDAYKVQAALHDWQRSQGQGPVHGYKIGCTTAVMQEIVGVPNPCFGGVLKSRVHHGSADFSFKDFQRVGIECEIAVRLSSDLPASDTPYDLARIEAAIGSCMAAIEVVDNRYGDFLSLPATVLIADDFFQSACVLGAEVTDWHGLDLADTEGRVYIDGSQQGSGLGVEVLGHPLQAVLWLANRLSSLGRGLKAGEFILTGSLTPVQWLDTGPARAVISIDGLGDVQALFD